MKAVRKLAEKVSEGFDLPAEALAGSGKLSVTAGKRLLAENYRGLIGYEENYVTVAMPEGKLTVWGGMLRIAFMTERELAVCGRIDRVEWDR